MPDYDHTDLTSYSQTYAGSDLPTSSMWHWVVRVGHVRTLTGWSIAHRSYGFLLQYVLAGRGTIKQRNVSFEAGKGDLIFLDCHMPYELRASAAQPWEFYWMVFDSAVAHLWTDTAGCDRMPVFRPRGASWMANRFRRAMNLARRRRPGFEAELSALVHAIVARIFADKARQQGPGAGPAKPLTAPASREPLPQPVRWALDFMVEKFYLPISSADVVKFSRVSHSHLYALFRSALGSTPMAYLCQHRLRHAQELLRHTNLPIKAICAQTGIEDPSYFSRLFRQRLGISPRQYRAESHRPSSPYQNRQNQH